MIHTFALVGIAATIFVIGMVICLIFEYFKSKFEDKKKQLDNTEERAKYDKTIQVIDKVQNIVLTIGAILFMITIFALFVKFIIFIFKDLVWLAL